MRRTQLLADFYVKKSTEAIHGSNRNLMIHNWFSSLALATEICKPPYNLTLVGTLHGNKHQIPKELQNTRTIGTSVFCFDGDKSLVSY